ncbi:MAG: hypothetical protein JST22_15395 [Bacteroidetes bacterium]|nr:hypothetical protein [Bacteroidota bacterium]HVZ41631.1 hypothetical protein [Candidatus Kapabacteria bacterium]
MQRTKNAEQIQAEENIETIQSMDQRYRGETQDVRIRMLRFLVDGSMVIIGC